MLRAAKRGDWEMAYLCMTEACGSDHERHRLYVNRKDRSSTLSLSRSQCLIYFLR
jgi:hypothetical protein